jgi:BMFP domain-containing protein YqiC
MSNRLDIVEREIKNIEENMKFNGRKQLQIQVLDYDKQSFGGSRANYFWDKKTIEISVRFEESFPHEYGHFLYYEAMHIRPKMNEKIHNNFMKILFDSSDVIDKNKLSKAFDKVIKEMPNRVAKDIVSRYSELMIDNFNILPQVNKKSSMADWQSAYEYYDYYCDPTEIVARVIAQYATGDYSSLSRIDSSHEFQVMSDYIGNKYFKKEIYKSMKRIMENNCA